jgi:hypothetical protein
MAHREMQKLFDGWATAHVVPVPQPLTHLPEAQPLPLPTFSEPSTGLDLAISKRPIEQIEVLSPTGRPVGDHYFRAYPRVRFLPGEIARLVRNLWLHAAVIRYCELWGAFSAEKFVRGYRGTVRLRVWIDRVIQGNVKGGDRVSLKHRQDNTWGLADPQVAYPHIRRWSSQAIASARKFAWEYGRPKEHEATQE